MKWVVETARAPLADWNKSMDPPSIVWIFVSKTSVYWLDPVANSAFSSWEFPENSMSTYQGVVASGVGGAQKFLVLCTPLNPLPDFSFRYSMVDTSYDIFLLLRVLLLYHPLILRLPISINFPGWFVRWNMSYANSSSSQFSQDGAFILSW